ncbi:MAG: histidinol phosphate phosphatase domain-containing protein [Desulfomicrobiaceae bacterium]|nr:histidinol phosphate phosphatase domain-containing protein [Desulfomicrobiaceae bacterium]
MIADLCLHSCLSDGRSTPAAMLARAHMLGLRAVALAEHADKTTIARVLERIRELAGAYSALWDLVVVPAVELTGVPPAALAEEVLRARALGADLVLVHGEGMGETAAPGTNLAAIEAGADILAHPGLMGETEAARAAQTKTALMLTARPGHCLANGHVWRLARHYGAPVVVTSGAHQEGELLGPGGLRAVALGAGMEEREWRTCQTYGWVLACRELTV